MITNLSTIQRFLLTGLLGLWGLFATVAFADKAPQGLSDTQWQNIQRQIQSDQQNSVAPEARALTLSETKLVAGDGAAWNYFGDAISLDGKRLAIGAPHVDIGGNYNQGAVYIFDFDGSNWVQSAKISTGDGAESDYFGSAVSLDGDRLAVGAYDADIGAISAQGAVYIFNFNGSSWVQSQKLTANDGAGGDYFGRAVSLDGDHLAVGAHSDDIGANFDQGSVYVFTLGTSGWSPSAKLVASDGAAWDEFGLVVSLEGEHLAVGAYGADIGGNNAQGAAYVFDLVASSWVQSQKLIANDGAAFDYFGRSLSLNGSRLAIGADGDDIGGNSSQGAAYIFDFDGSNWAQSQKLIAGDGAANDRFGRKLSLNGNRLAVGVFFADIGGNSRQGAVYLFDLGGSGWSQTDKRTAGGGAAGDNFGHAVALGANRLAVGAYGTAISGNSNEGAVYVYDGLPAYVITGLSGTWYDPAYDGSGFNLVQLSNSLLVYYYGYKKNGNGTAQWLLSDIIPGTVAAGETYTATMYAGTPGNGGSLTNKPTAPGSGVSIWGQVEITLENCNKGSVRLTGADGMVTHNIVPLAKIAGLSCTSSTTNEVSYTAPSTPAGTFSALSGTWYDPIYDGSGFNVIQIPNGLLLYYYGYKVGADGQALWLLSDTISQPITVGNTVTVDLYAGFIGNGGSFTQKPTKNASGLTRWGQAEVTFNDCDTGTIRLIGNHASVTHNIVPLAPINGVNCRD